MLAAAAALSLTSCLTNAAAFPHYEADPAIPPEEQAPEPLKVGVVGDSNTRAIEKGRGLQDSGNTYLTDALNQYGYITRVSADIGATTADLAGVVWAVEPKAEGDAPLSTNLDIALVALGTNDGRIDNTTGQPRLNIEQIETNVNNYLNRVTGYGLTNYEFDPAISENPDQPNPHESCEVLVTVKEEPSWGLDQTAPAINAMLRRQAEARGGVVYEWNESAMLNPGDFDTDQIHHTAVGQERYRNGFVEHINACKETLQPKVDSTSAAEQLILQ